ncbi:glycosyltransferase family 4 protein [Opitutales bacterium]|nr:glycosyltransferase family 4 protein [Opitutales bacterium]
MKKLAIVYHYFAHYREPVLRELCERLSADYEIELLADEQAEIPALKTVALAEFCEGLCGFQKLKNIWLGPWLWQSGLLSSVIRNKADVIIFLGQFNFLSTWLAVLLARLMGKKTYFWSHGVYGNEGALKRFIRVTFYRLADGMLLYGNYSKNLLIKYGMDAERLEVIYNSLDYRQQKQLRDLKSEECVAEVRSRLFGEANSDRPYLLFIGRLTAVKRLDLLIRTVAELKKKGCEVNCLIVGEGPEKVGLRALAKSEMVSEQICFHGGCHKEEVLSDLIYAAEVCVAPGNVGLSAMHSLVYGTPVITHGEKCWQMPEFEAIVPGLNGDFFERNNLEDLVERTEVLLNRSAVDRALIRVKCYNTIDEKYNPSNQADVISRVIG